jgi:ADP-ribosyl-[dinitrogen reductase] hydrolase
LLLEIGVGDAYGAGFEFSTTEKVEKFNNLTQYCEHELGIAPGHYTDDTQMSVAIAELMMSDVPWTPGNIADKFVGCFKRDQRLGYSKGFYQFLISINSGKEFIAKIDSRSNRNGAAMRSAPLGYIKVIDDLLNMAEIQAVVTHNTFIGIKSSQAVALAAHYFIYYHGDVKGLTEFVSHYTNYSWQDDWGFRVECSAQETVNAFLSVMKKSKSLREILINSVSLTGDVDTVAALGLGVGSLCEEYEPSLPGFLYNDFENGLYGKSFLESISDKLINYYGLPPLK